VILEALYFNLPCISTNVGDTSELLASGRGIIVHPSDSDGLLNAFYNMLDYLKKNQNAQNGFRKNYVLKEFNPNICLEKYSKLILIADED
jgi:glycosyltransferase involved in cell wall biosynthesis